MLSRLIIHTAVLMVIKRWVRPTCLIAKLIRWAELAADFVSIPRLNVLGCPMAWGLCKNELGPLARTRGSASLQV